MVLVDKEQSGKRGMEEFSQWLDQIREKAQSLMPDEKKQHLEMLIQKLRSRRGFGALVYLTALLFGLTTGLIHDEGFDGTAEVEVDREFVKQREGWDLIFGLLAKWWPTVAELGVFPLWPKENQPQWHLGSTVTEVDSTDSYGVQLADFIAYVTRRNCENPADLNARRVAIINQKCDQVPFAGYKGISLVVSHKLLGRAAPRRQYPKPHKLPQRFIDRELG